MILTLLGQMLAPRRKNGGFRQPYGPTAQRVPNRVLR